jgi:hypothetical protein
MTGTTTGCRRHSRRNASCRKRSPDGSGTTCRLAGRKLRGEIISAGEHSVRVAASDGAETEIPYHEIVRANLIPMSDLKGSVT